MKTTITTVASASSAAVLLVGPVAAFAPEVSVVIPSRPSTNFCDTSKILLHAKTADDDDKHDLGLSSESTSPLTPWEDLEWRREWRRMDNRERKELLDASQRSTSTSSKSDGMNRRGFLSNVMTAGATGALFFSGVVGEAPKASPSLTDSTSTLKRQHESLAEWVRQQRIAYRAKYPQKPFSISKNRTKVLKDIGFDSSHAPDRRLLEANREWYLRQRMKNRWQRFFRGFFQRNMM